jgi:hypothetical protein
MPELRHDRTAVTTIAFITSAAPGMPICSSEAMNGELPASTSFHGTMHTTRRIDRT